MATANGRRNQVASRTTHGLRSRAPILVGLEDKGEWDEHLESFRAYFKPVGGPKEFLVEYIAYQAWIMTRRLIPHECELTRAHLRKPDRIIDAIDPELIQEVMQHSAAKLMASLKAELARLDRYEALGNGVEPQVSYSKEAEVEEIVSDWLNESGSAPKSKTETNSGKMIRFGNSYWMSTMDLGPHAGCRNKYSNSATG